MTDAPHDTPHMDDGRPAFKAQCTTCNSTGEQPALSPEGGYPCQSCDGRGWFLAPDTPTYREVCRPYLVLPSLLTEAERMAIYGNDAGSAYD